MTLTREETFEVLEDILRNGRNAVARIAAIKLLLEMQREEPAETSWDEDFDRRFPGLRG